MFQDPILTLSQKIKTSHSNSPRILIIDDDKDICQLLSQFVKLTGCSVEIATNPKEAIEKLVNSLKAYLDNQVNRGMRLLLREMSTQNKCYYLSRLFGGDQKGVYIIQSRYIHVMLLLLLNT